MSNYNNLKTTIDANIKQNGNQEITGPILNSVLNQMVNILGTGYQFAGVATLDPATDPGTPDAKVFYIANGKGTYTKFGGIEVTEDDVVVLYWDTAWHKVATGIASQAKLSELDSEGKRINLYFTEQEIKLFLTQDKYHIPSDGDYRLRLIAGDKISISPKFSILPKLEGLYIYCNDGTHQVIYDIYSNNEYLVTIQKDSYAIGFYWGNPSASGVDTITIRLTDNVVDTKVNEVCPIKEMLSKSAPQIDGDVTMVDKSNFIGRFNGYINADGVIVSNEGYTSYIYDCKNLVSIDCIVGGVNGNEYAVSFFDNIGLYDDTTIIKDNSVLYKNQGSNKFVITDIPRLAKAVIVSNRADSLPINDMQVNLTYNKRAVVRDNEIDTLACLSSEAEITRELFCDISTDGILMNDTDIPFYANKGDYIFMQLDRDSANLFKTKSVDIYICYYDGSLSSSISVGLNRTKVFCDKKVVALRVYALTTDIVADGKMRLITHVDGSHTISRVFNVTESVTKGGYIFLLEEDKIIIDAKRGDIVSFVVKTDVVKNIPFYYYLTSSSKRVNYFEATANQPHRFYCPTDIKAIGFYAAEFTKDGDIDIEIEVISGEDRLKLPSWYSESYMAAKEERIKALIQGANGKAVSFAFITDEHIDFKSYNFKSPALIKHLCDNVNINAVFNGGDISNGKDFAIMDFASVMKLATTNSKLYNIIGNHEYHEGYSDGQLYYHLGIGDNKVGNPSRGYYYVDDALQKIRYVIVNAFKSSGNSIAYGYEDAQIEWLRNEAFDTPSDWKVIVFSHSLYVVPIYEDENGYPYYMNERANLVMSAIAENNARSDKGKVIFCVQGHVHNDRIISSAVTGSVPIITTTCDAVYPTYDAQGRPDVNVVREVGTISEQAIDVFVVNLESNVVNIVRIGANARDGVDANAGNEVEERILYL